MRICMVTDNYYPYIGGIAEHIHHLAVELRARGHTAKILTTDFSSRAFECLGGTPDEEHVFRIGKSVVLRSNKSFTRVTLAPNAVARVRRYFEQERFDVVHVHGSLAPTLPLVALRASRTVNVLTFHANHEQSLGYALFRPLLLSYFRQIHGLVAVSTAAETSASKYFPGPYRIIPNGIDVDFFNPKAEPMPELNNGRPKVLFMGRFEPRKGLKYLLMAVPEVVRQVPEVQFVVVGAGLFGYAYKSYLEKQYEPNVHWAGLIPGEQRPRYMASCDIFCSPAIGNESFGIVLLEGMATGKPVVASDIPGYRTVMTDGREGLLAPPRDPAALGTALVRLLKDPELAGRMGAVGRDRAVEFSWPRVARRIEALYEELVRDYPRPRFGRKRS